MNIGPKTPLLIQEGWRAERRGGYFPVFEALTNHRLPLRN